MKNIILTSLFAVLCLPALAQKDNNKIESLRVAFFTEKLNLTTEESSEFWIRHNEYESSLEKLKEQKKEIGSHIKNLDSMSDEEIRREIETVRDLDILEAEVRTDFILDCINILDAQRAGRLPQLEREFRKAIIEKRRGNDGRPPHGRPPHGAPQGRPGGR